MSKPDKLHCSYCNLVDECTRTSCSRKAIFPLDGSIQMVEKKIYNRWRFPELMRLYKEVPLTKADLMTKY